MHCLCLIIALKGHYALSNQWETLKWEHRAYVTEPYQVLTTQCDSSETKTRTLETGNKQRENSHYSKTKMALEKLEKSYSMTQRRAKHVLSIISMILFSFQQHINPKFLQMFLAWVVPAWAQCCSGFPLRSTSDQEISNSKWCFRRSISSQSMSNALSWRQMDTVCRTLLSWEKRLWKLLTTSGTARLFLIKWAHHS